MEKPGIKFVLGKPLSGWLRRQGGVLGGWQRRYFVLQEGWLHSTRSEDTRINHTYCLKDYNLKDVTTTPEESYKFAFELVSEKGHGESVMLCASNIEDKMEWMKALAYHIYADRGGAIFGLPLEEAMKHERKQGRSIPHIVEACVVHLSKYGMETEGIFRLAGRAGILKELRRKYEMGEQPDLDNIDIHTVGSLLKTYLRELPESLILPCLYQRAMNIAMRYSEAASDEARVPELNGLSKLLEELPEANFSTLNYICQFLQHLAAKSEKTKMDAHNLALVFGPNLIRHIDNNPELFMLTADLTHHLAYMLIQYYPQVFPDRSCHDTRSCHFRDENLIVSDKRKNSENLLELVLADLKDIGFTSQPHVLDMFDSSISDGVSSHYSRHSQNTFDKDVGLSAADTIRHSEDKLVTSSPCSGLNPVVPKRNKRKTQQYNRSSHVYIPADHYKCSQLDSQSSDMPVAASKSTGLADHMCAESASMDGAEENSLFKSQISPVISSADMLSTDNSQTEERTNNSGRMLEKLCPSRSLLDAQVMALKAELARLKSQSRRQVSALKDQLKDLYSKYEARIASMEKQHDLQIKNLEAKLSDEKKARNEAVEHTISLETELKRYQLQYGRLFDTY